jgi:DNA-directed RNA polymerase sigma subunit (sigma70/sigma32)
MAKKRVKRKNGADLLCAKLRELARSKILRLKIIARSNLSEKDKSDFTEKTSRLSEVENGILRCLYGINTYLLTPEETAPIFKMSVDRVKKVEARALAKLIDMCVE